MKSQWFHLKSSAIKLRKQGFSIRHIESKLKIPRSTLSGWFKYISLTTQQENRLQKRWDHAMIKARRKAVIWHNEQKKMRIKEAHSAARATLKNVSFENLAIIEVALAFLYLGEGNKTNVTSLGNSDPLILKFYILVLRRIYKVPTNDFRCELHLRAD